MHVQFIQARCELEAERNTITCLQNIIDKLTTSCTAPMHMASEPGPRDGPIDTLVIPDAPEALEEDNYPDVPYWRGLVWAQHSDQQKDCEKPVSKLGFLTDQDGCPVSKIRIKEFMSHTKQMWNELYCHCLDPSSWMRKTTTAAAFYAHEMRKKYEEFGYCDGNWKAEWFAIIKYPDWCPQEPCIVKSEFKTMWDNISSETKKKYEALSKQKKLAACNASSTVPAVSNSDNNVL
ncbi:hypothetical protein EI94DRAFT_1794024 [Lactarius quietus]|nr:hypothetical protein EI94DRAFT_1794024 [Lactarius quietus]